MTRVNGQLIVTAAVAVVTGITIIIVAITTVPHCRVRIHQTVELGGRF